MKKNVPWLAFPVEDFYSVRKGPHPRPQFINALGLFRGVIDIWGCSCCVRFFAHGGDESKAGGGGRGGGGERESQKEPSRQEGGRERASDGQKGGGGLTPARLIGTRN